MRTRIDILNKKNEILQWVSENLPNAEIARRLKCKVDTLKSYYKN
jgi:DNA-binding CsgD family transcriptional regulator